MKVYKEFSFEAAHLLPQVPDGHKCKRLHGHSFKVVIWVSGEVDQHLGWVLDFGDIKKNFEPLLKILDHSYLNEIEGLENPTGENIARWIWQRLTNVLPGLARVEVRETCTAGVVFTGLGFGQ